MKYRVPVRLGAILLASPALPIDSAFAQTTGPTGSEVIGHSVEVDTGGVVNTVYFDRDGVARIVGAGGEQVAGNWLVQDRTLCLSSGTTRECWPYQAAFQAGMPVELTSDCGATSRWTATSTEPPPAPPPAQTRRAGERG